LQTQQHLETHQLRYHVALVNYIITYILQIQDTRRYLHPTFPSASLHQMHFHAQSSQGVDGDSFGSSLSTQLVKLLKAS
jgi:carbonic anhydrase